jgi:hypothetical protein
MSEPKGPTLEQIAGLKLRLRTLPDELNVAREAVARLSAACKDAKAMLAEREAETAAFSRAALIDAGRSAGKKTPETTLAVAVKADVEQDVEAQRLRASLREIEYRRDGAELQVQHLEDRFRGLQVYASLTVAEVHLLMGGHAA